MILICQVAGGARLRGRDSRGPDNLPILSIFPGPARIQDQLTTPLTAGAGDTTAATSGAGTSRFASGTSGRAPVSSSDSRPFRTARTATGDTGRASLRFKREPQYPGRPGKRSGRSAVARPASGPPGQRPGRAYDMNDAFMQLLRHERGNHAV
jgi:hypothetical protein